MDRAKALEQGQHGAVFDKQAGAEVTDPFDMSTDRETFQQNPADPSPLPVVYDRDSGLRDLVARGITHISRYP
jgi:hypothetical protein